MSYFAFYQIAMKGRQMHDFSTSDVGGNLMANNFAQ
jgi:hypothetical protein